MAKPSKSLRALFDEASEIEDEQARRSFVDEACAGDAALRANLEELLRAGESAGGFLADPKRDAATLAAPTQEREGDRIGRYKLLQKIGEGGCGVVYMAEQLEPVRRRVALKVIKLGMDTVSVIARFEAERQALALMDHPSIARVLDAGTTETGRPFFVMELVRGIKITDFCEQNDLSTAERLQLFIQVCQAVQHAHQKGIIHRDLKPSNVLVTSADGVPLPKVIDFGIAKATADVQLTDKTLFTRFEMFLGTPAYMSPEQAELNANDVDTRTDIYSLGVLLYELLTGRPPFEAETWHNLSVDALRKAIREKEPTRPSTRLTKELNAVAAARKSAADQAADGGALTSRRCNRLKETIAQLRGDLDWIVLKALEKDRTRRYETANGLAADIQRHLRHEPVIARPPSPIYLFQKNIRRNRSTFLVAATLALLLVAGVVFTTRDAVRTRRDEKIQRDLRERAESNQRKAESARNDADAANRALTRNLFIREWLDAEGLLDAGKIDPAMAWFARAARQHPGDVAVQTRLLSMLTERNFALPLDRPMVHGAPLNNAAWLSDGLHLVTAGDDGSVRIWSLNSDAEPLVLSNRFIGPAVAAIPGTNLVLVDEAQSISVWRLNELVKTVALSHEVNRRLPVSTDGRWASIFGPDKGLHLWDPVGLKPVGRQFDQISISPALYGFSPDGKYVIGTDKTSHLCAWDISGGNVVWQSVKVPGFVAEGIVEAQVQPDGKRLIVSHWLSAGRGELSGWAFEPSSSGVPLMSAPSAGWVLPVSSVIGTWCFSSDGNELYVGDAEGHLGIVDLTQRELHILNGQHDGRVTWMGLSSDGQRLATASVDGTARLWDMRMKSPAPLVISNGASVEDAKFSPDSRWFVCAGEREAQIRNAHSAALLRRLPLDQVVRGVDISNDGRRVVACGSDGRTEVWDTETGVPLFPPLQGGPADAVQFSRDGRWFLILSSTARMEIHETETGGQLGSTLTNTTRGVTATFSPDGSTVVVGADNGTIEFWSLAEGRRLEKPARHRDVVWTARFSPDGKLLLTSSRDRTAALWEADSGKLAREFRHDQQVYTAAFSPDGSRIVTGDASGKAHIWDAQTGKRLFSLPAHPGGVWYGEFSSDGRALLTGDDAGNARLWEASSGLPLSGWVHNGSSLKCTHFSPDGRLALSASQDGTVRVWPIVIAPLPAPAWLPDLAETIAGHRLRDDGTPETVPPERWLTLKASLASLQGNDFYARWARWFFSERMKERPAAFAP